MNSKTAKANVEPVRQRTQYSCMASAMAMCLRANDHDVTEDDVNRVMGARPMKGAAWEQALACAQHYGCRATLTMPATVEQLKAWTDAGIPIMIAWNPEGRDWSHASVVFDVDDDLNVYVADPNIPNPKETVRIVSENDFYGKWYEKFPDYLVRRPACAIEREVTVRGRQVMASTKATRLKMAESYDCWKDGLRGQELADCYKRFPSDLGSKEIRHVKKFYPGWSPRQVPTRSLSLDAETRSLIVKNIVVYGMKGAKAVKDIEFLKSLSKSKKPLSLKQRDWLDNIFKNNERYTRQIPDGFDIELNPYLSNIEVFPKSTSSTALRWLHQNAWVEESGSGRLGIKGDKADKIKAEKAEARANAQFDKVRSSIHYNEKDWHTFYFERGVYHSVYRDPSERYKASLSWDVDKISKNEHDITPRSAINIGIQDEQDKRVNKYLTIELGNNDIKDSQIYALAMINAVLQGKDPKKVQAPTMKRKAPPPPPPISKPKAPKAPAAPKTVVDSATAEKINILNMLADKVKNWPEGLEHVEKILGEYNQGRNPNDDDLRKLRNILYKNRMRGEANHFRQASSETPMQVAIWAAWDAMLGVERVRDADTFIATASSLAMSVSTGGDDLSGTKFERAADGMLKKLKNLEKQSRSWRSAYNLWDKVDVDPGRLGRDMEITFKGIVAIQKSIMGMAGIKRTFPNIWEEEGVEYEFNRAAKASQNAIEAFKKALHMLKSGKMAGSSIIVDRVDSRYMEAKNKPESMKTKLKIDKSKAKVKDRNPAAKARAEQTGGGGAGKHHNRSRDVAKGRARKPKHKKPVAAASIERVAQKFMRMAAEAAYSGNPDGKPIYDVNVDHGEDQALSGGHDIMKRLQDRYLKEQGSLEREKNPRLARGANLNRVIRQKANAKLSRAGLDGNGRFRKPERAYSAALTTLSEFGIELGEVVSSHLFQARPSGTLNIELAFSNPEDPFSPEAISNSTLHLQWTELHPDHFEVIAYLS